MGNSLDDLSIFSDEKKTFDNLLVLLNTSVGYSTYENQLDEDII